MNRDKSNKAKEFLNKVRLQVCYCHALAKEIQQVREDNYSLQSSISGGGSSSGGKTHDLSGGEIRAEKYEEKLIHASEARDRMKLQALDLIQGLDDDLKKSVLFYRYIIGLGWEEVCVSVHKSWRQTHRIHAEALIELEEKFRQKKMA